jgi:hypothetical protein
VFHGTHGIVPSLLCGGQMMVVHGNHYLIWNIFFKLGLAVRVDNMNLSVLWHCNYLNISFLIMPK